jgi:hypothetical protein
MKLNKHLLLLILTFSSLWGIRSQAQTVTPQWKAGTGYILNFYPGKSPAGYDTLGYVGYLRNLFKLKSDRVNTDGYVTHGYFNSHTPIYTASNGITKVGNEFQLGGALTDYSNILLAGYGLNIGDPIEGTSTYNFGQSNFAFTGTTDGLVNYGRVGGSGVGVYLVGKADSKQVSFNVEGTQGESVYDTERRGIKYLWDGDENLSDSSLVPKRYVDSIAGTGSIVLYTGSNGIIKVGNDFQLGGSPLTQNTYIQANDNYFLINGTHYFDVPLYDYIGNQTTQIYYDPIQGVNMSVVTESTGSTHNTSNLRIDNQKIEQQLLVNGRGIQGLTFSMSNTGSEFNPILLSDPIRKGFLYNWDNDSNLSDSSLVPKRYVDSTAKAKADSVFSSVDLTFENGLTNTSGIVKLGGTLNQFTNLNINGNTLQIYSSTGTGYASGSSFDEQQNAMSNGETVSEVQGGTSILTTAAEVSLNTNNILGGGRTATFKLNSGGKTAFAPIDTSYSAMYRDDFKHAGIVYSHVNRNNYTDTTLVDKGYVCPVTGTPTIVAGAGAGISPTVSVMANGKQLQVIVTTGTSPTESNATIATVTLANALSYTPYPVFSSANANTASLSGASMIYMTSSGTTNVTITSGTTALTASTTYVWNITL